MRFEDFQIDAECLARLCEEYGIARLEVVDSFAAGRATSESDLLLLVRFIPVDGRWPA